MAKLHYPTFLSTDSLHVLLLRSDCIVFLYMIVVASIFIALQPRPSDQSTGLSLILFFIRCNTFILTLSLSLGVAVVLLCFDGLWIVIVAVHPSIILSVRSERRDSRTRAPFLCTCAGGHLN